MNNNRVVSGLESDLESSKMGRMSSFTLVDRAAL